ncbi:MAG TPA: hypothetical protein VE093_48000 [Polyangiaceae bacterium]|nr:hypothetical protein [Polyangiaceae bacterium]
MSEGASRPAGMDGECPRPPLSVPGEPMCAARGARRNNSGGTFELPYGSAR